MSSSKNSKLYGFLFVAIFVVQQILSFVWKTFTLVSPYWIAIILVTLVVGFKLPLKKYSASEAFKFTLVCAICSIPTFLNGTSPGEVVVKIFYIFAAYFGFILLNEKRIELKWFDLLLLILYVFFYNAYFSKDIVTRLSLNGDLFGHSSSNTIAISLNIVLWFYYVLNQAYGGANSKKLLLFSIVNLVLIVIQGSRAGIIVALLLLLLIAVANFNVQQKRTKYLVYVIVFAGAFYLISRALPMLEGLVDITNMQGVSSYEEDVRSLAQASFFNKLDFSSALIGYDYKYEFVGDITRTFNAFLDFWKTFGLLPMIFLMVGIVKRIVRRDKYKVSLLCLTPIIAYSFVESLWGGTFWDVIIFICLFWPKNSPIFYE